MFGDQIRKMRESKQISQSEFARLLGVSRQSVCNWEHSTITPSLDLLIRISDVLGCSTDYILETDYGRTFIETTNLTERQIAHIQNIVTDYEYFNSIINDLQPNDEQIK